MKQQFDTPEPVSLYVELGKGRVEVSASETGQTLLSVDGAQADEVEVEHTGNQISIVAPRPRAGFFGGGEARLEITVTVPAGSDLVTKTGSADQRASGSFRLGRLKSGSGDVELDRFTDDLLVDTGSGDVKVREVGGELRVKSGSGDVEVGTVAGGVAISTGSGDITVETSTGPALVKSGSGDLTVRNAETDVSLSSASGDLSVGRMLRGVLSAKNASGDIRVGIPSGIPVWTDVSSVTGRIGSDLEGAGQPGPGEDHIEVRAKTVSGDIVLKQL